MHSIDRSRLQKLKDKLIAKAAFLYMIDQRENNREILLREDELKRRIRDGKTVATETFSPR
jgi:hypothetical protein